jgi:2-polyprenyl-3-methyl-5-hydroxy-6-metoxy-1,4-benzoquinol methylase
MDLKSTYNRIARDWIEDHKNDNWWTSVVEIFINNLTIGDEILDVGCAGGFKSHFFQEKGFNVTGIDFSEEMIKIAKEKYAGCQFFIKDIQIPLNFKYKFKGIFAQAVLLHIEKRKVEQVLVNLIEVLEDNGYLYFAVKESRSGQNTEGILKENDYGYEYERFFSYFSFLELKNYLKKLNMTIIYSDIISHEKTNWIQIIAQNSR